MRTLVTITSKIKSVLSRYGFSFADYARQLNIFPQTLNNKAKKNAYKVQDLIELGDLTHTELCLRDLETKEVIMTFKKSDLEIGND
ncbi:MAG: hypothetical protein ACLT22_11895 [Coprobacillus cateniformis]|uniref:hypothetical protein n=1 Tax=Coprobacillus cateniformis TaxID=100884 RepID=UPI001ED907C4|nr:hypothetical protein [Coprobacillus cateniformis]